MIPVSPIVGIIGFLLMAFIGALTGAVTGWTIQLVIKRPAKEIVKDAFFGSCGFLIGFIGCFILPWPQNTIAESLSSGATLTTTTNSFPHPAGAAFVIAILLPTLYELCRYKRSTREV